MPYDWQSTAQATSTGTGNVQTITPNPQGPKVALVTVETNPARVTLDGSAPGAGNGLIIQKDANPLLLLWSSDVLKFASTIAGNSILNVTWGY